MTHDSASRAIAKVLAAALCFALIPTANGGAADLKLLAAGSLTPAMGELVPEFQKVSGHKVAIVYGNINALADRVDKGEAADVVITSFSRLQALAKAGRVVPASQTTIASVGAGVAIHKGGAKPDVSSVEALKRTLLAAKTISYGDPGVGNPTGLHMSSLMERLGIAANMTPKTKLIRGVPAFVTLFDDIRTGATELGIEQISLIVEAPGIELAGPLPPAVQSYTQFAAGLVAAGGEHEAARALLQFISTPSAKAVLKSKGFDVP